MIEIIKVEDPEVIESEFGKYDDFKNQGISLV